MNPEVRRLLERAAALRLASLTLGHPRPGRAEEMRALADEVPHRLRPLAAAIAKMDMVNADAAHHRILGSAGVVSGCESIYSGAFSADKGTVLADVSAFYEAFAFQPGEEIPEPSDHVSVQLSYLAFLSIKEALAFFQGEEGKVEICAKAYHDFCTAHLGRWCAALEERLSLCEGSELPLAGVRLAREILPPRSSAKSDLPSL